MTPRPASDERMLLLLERKRVLDSVWLVTLGFQLVALMLPARTGAELGAAGLRVLACGALYVIAADLGYRLRTAAAVRRAIYATQCGAVLCLSALWALSGGLANPLGLVFFAPPLLAAGLVGSSRLPWASTALSLLAVWTIAWQAPAEGAGDPLPAAGALGAFSIAALLLAAVSRALGDGLMRLYERVRAHSHPAEEARGLLEALWREMPDPSLVVYADTLQVAHASESFHRRALRRPHEVAGRSLYNVLRFEDRARFEAELARGSGELRFQALWIGPERIVANVRFFHAVTASGARVLHLSLREVTELEHLRTAFDALDDAVLLVGGESELLYANAAAEGLLGELYLGKPMADLLRAQRLAPRGGARRAASRERVELDGAPWRLAVRQPRRGDAAPECTLFWLSPFDESEARADRDARDPLTGALNRRAFEEALREGARSAGPAAPLGLALFRLDTAKDGDPAAADRLRAAFARALAEEHRLGDRLCRIDEDDFALVLPGLARDSAEVALRRILWALERRPPAGGASAPVSVGASVWVPGESVAAWVARADAALAEAVAGGGGVCVAPGGDAATS